MSLILVVEPQNRHAEPVIRALTADGYNVKVVGSRDEALRAAAYEAPSLVLVGSELPSAATLMDAFASKRGGPGVVALVANPEQAPFFAVHADQVLAEPICDADYRDAVRDALAQARGGASAAMTVDAGQKLSSADIFGDLLAEVEETPKGPPTKVSSAELFGDMLAELDEEELSEAGPGAKAATSHPNLDQPALAQPIPAAPTNEPVQAVEPVAPPQVVVTPSLGDLAPVPSRPPTKTAARRPAPVIDKEIQRKLDLTLSGVLDSAPKPKRGSRTVKPSSSDVDDLLSRTLSSLDLKTKSPKKRTGTPAKKKRTATDLAAEIDKLGQPPASEAQWPMVERRKAKPPVATFKPVSAGQEFGQYTLLEKIAIGGMAEVWKARMKGVEGFQKTVAIKKILHHLTDNESFVNMFIDEAKLAAQLSHPNITHIYDLGKLDEDYYIAMEFVEGRNLRSILDAAQRSGIHLPVGVSLLIAARLASALDYAHRKRGFDDRQLGLVHRDVSPQNVLLSYEGDIKLCDFGIVKAVSRAQHTQMGALKGKLQYMSPEQARGHDVDGRSDLFSLGALLFEMLVGRRLFPGDNELSVLEAVRECDLPAPVDLNPSIPAVVDAMVRRALSKDPDDRFQTASDMQQEIESILNNLDPTPGQADLAALMHRLLNQPAPTHARATATPAPQKPATVTPATTVESAVRAAAEFTAKPTIEPAAPVEPLVEPPVGPPVEPPVEPPAIEPEDSPPVEVTTPPEFTQETPPPAPVAVEAAASPPGSKAGSTPTASHRQADDTATAPPVQPPLETSAEGGVVELITPSAEVDPELAAGSSRGRWRILVLLLLALAAAAALAWSVQRKRAQPATPPPAGLAQPALTQPADPGDSTPPAEQEDAGQPVQEGPNSTSPNGDEPQAGAKATGITSTAPSPVSSALSANSRVIEEVVDREVARREALRRAELEKQQRELEAQLSAVQAAQQESASAESSNEEPTVSNAEPPRLQPRLFSVARLVPSLEGEYSALVTVGVWPKIRAHQVFGLNATLG